MTALIAAGRWVLERVDRVVCLWVNITHLEIGGDE